MKDSTNQSWIEDLTDIVLEVENTEEDNKDNIRHLGVQFFEEAIEICQVLQDIDTDEKEEDEEAFVDLLIRCGTELNASLSSFDRSTGVPKDELCYDMYRFISLLSQRINFGKPQD